jgi:hypothetical protein
MLVRKEVLLVHSAEREAIRLEAGAESLGTSRVWGVSGILWLRAIPSPYPGKEIRMEKHATKRSIVSTALDQILAGQDPLTVLSSLGPTLDLKISFA